MTDFEQRLAAAKRASFLQPLFRSARLLTALGVARKASRNGLQPRPAHMALYPHIELGGTRPSVLAERVGITPQAVAQLIRDLEQMGLVERRPDPADGRAKLVMFTAAGLEDILDGFTRLEGLEAELSARLGPEEFDTLRRLVARLDEVAAELTREAARRED